jgi:hypothetical protein
VDLKQQLLARHFENTLSYSLDEENLEKYDPKLDVKFKIKGFRKGNGVGFR